MRGRSENIWAKLDKPLLLLYLALVFFGLFTIYSASYSEDHPHIYDWGKAYGKQLFWIVACLVVGVIIVLLESNFIQNIAYITYGVVILLLGVVLLMPDINGAHSWFKIGGFTIQPSEFSKFATSLAIAKYMSTTGVKIDDIKTKLTVVGLLAIPAFLIVIQPDPGTALVFFSFIFVMYREGLSGNILLGVFFAVIIGVLSIFLIASNATAEIFGMEVAGNYLFVGVIILVGVVAHILIRAFVLPRYRKPKFIANIVATSLAVLMVLPVNWVYNNVFQDRHRDRFEVMFGLKLERKGVGYNIYQAKSAIGSGGLSGKGYMQGTLSNDKYQHVPEQSTDFIFCSLAEEWGFIGGVVMIALFLAFLIRIIQVAERQKSKFTRIMGYCTASFIFFHFMINTAMVIGLAPVIGIPLPFFSKGGSAILGFSIMVFILLRLDAERKDVLR